MLICWAECWRWAFYTRGYKILSTFGEIVYECKLLRKFSAEKIDFSLEVACFWGIFFGPEGWGLHCWHQRACWLDCKKNSTHILSYAYTLLMTNAWNWDSFCDHFEVIKLPSPEMVQSSPTKTDHPVWVQCAQIYLILIFHAWDWNY